MLPIEVVFPCYKKKKKNLLINCYSTWANVISFPLIWSIISVPLSFPSSVFAKPRSKQRTWINLVKVLADFRKTISLWIKVAWINLVMDWRFSSQVYSLSCSFFLPTSDALLFLQSYLRVFSHCQYDFCLGPQTIPEHYTQDGFRTFITKIPYKISLQRSARAPVYLQVSAIPPIFSHSSIFSLSINLPSFIVSYLLI